MTKSRRKARSTTWSTWPKVKSLKGFWNKPGVWFAVLGHYVALLHLGTIWVPPLVAWLAPPECYKTKDTMMKWIGESVITMAPAPEFGA